MTQDEIIRMAREAGFSQPWTAPKQTQERLVRFAALVAAPWIETNKALAKEIIELKKQPVKQEPVKACVSGVCPNKAKCDAAQCCLYTEAEPVKQEHKCNPHPDAPHGFARNASLNAGRYVCECEGWEPDQAEQEPVAWGVRSTDDFLIFQNESQAQHYAAEWEFEVTPLYAAPVQQVPVGKVLLHEGDVNVKGYLYNPLPEGTDIYSAPVRTKDLTDDEICEIVDNTKPLALDFARAVIAADREKNK